jgi:methylaspartate ammonia-lyase
MLRILPLADDLILPQAKQEIYFFNRIDQKRTVKRSRMLVKSADVVPPADSMTIRTPIPPTSGH